jgi:adenylate kinase
MLSEIGHELDSVLFVDVDDAEATRRVLGRAGEEGRSDDAPEFIARRLAIYHEQTEPVIDHYARRGALVTLGAHRSVDEVFAEICAALGRAEP